jgi:hypothetical protein
MGVSRAFFWTIQQILVEKVTQLGVEKGTLGQLSKWGNNALFWAVLLPTVSFGGVMSERSISFLKRGITLDIRTKVTNCIAMTCLRIAVSSCSYRRNFALPAPTK